MTVNSVLDFLTPLIILVGKFAYITITGVWAGAALLFSYFMKPPAKSEPLELSPFTGALILKGKKLFRVLGLTASVLSILLILEVYRESNLSLYYLSFTVDVFVTLASYLIISEIFLIPALNRYSLLNSYMLKNSVSEKPVHSIALNSAVRRLCAYQVLPVLFILFTVASQFSVY